MARLKLREELTVSKLFVSAATMMEERKGQSRRAWWTAEHDGAIGCFGNSETRWKLKGFKVQAGPVLEWRRNKTMYVTGEGFVIPIL